MGGLPLERKYSLPGFITVEKDDIVFDCGSYVGGFSLHASRMAKMIYCFEPSKENYECIKRNFKDSSNIAVFPIGLYNTDEILEFNISASSVEHSFLPPDDGQIIGIDKVPVKRIDTICKENNIKEIDFLKIEAEGVEIEVFEGLGNFRPKKIAIDVSPERNGKSPVDFFIKKLPKLGYLIKLRGNVLFARR